MAVKRIASKVIAGVDLYNFATTGDIAKTLHCVAATDAAHIPCCILVKKKEKRNDDKLEQGNRMGCENQ